jgi:hypothetical protein
MQTHSLLALAVLVVCAGCESARTAGGIRKADEAGSGSSSLFDGVSLAGWQMAGDGKFVAVDGNLTSLPGCGGIGLLWNTTPTPPDFVLKLAFRRTADDDNSGVFVRFPDPGSKGFDNTAWVGVRFGFEVQIDETGRPDHAPQHLTGAIYDQPDQQFSLMPSLPAGQWNAYEIRVQGQTYTVLLNGTQVTRFVFDGDPSWPDRGLPSTASEPRFIGLQAETGMVSFRDIEIAPL